MISHCNLARLVPLALSLLLAGCFTSTAPKFPLANAVPALGDGGRYVGYDRQDDGSFKRESPVIVKHRSDGGYDFIDSDGKVTPASLHRVGPDLYVAQASNANSTYTDYVMLRIHGNEVLGFAPQCDDQNAAKMTALGVVIHDHECKIDAVADPAALFAHLKFGPPTMKLVRQ